jgi:hypothetical protein
MTITLLFANQFSGACATRPLRGVVSLQLFKPSQARFQALADGRFTGLPVEGEATISPPQVAKKRRKLPTKPHQNALPSPSLYLMS